MPHVQIRVPGLPEPYDGTSLASLQSYVHDVADFLSRQLASSVCLSHPNQLAISYGSGGSAEHELQSDWWEYFDVLSRGDEYSGALPSSLSVPSTEDLGAQVDRLKALVSSAQLPAGMHSPMFVNRALYNIIDKMA